MKSTQRFSDRVSNYVKYRPSYPANLIETLKTECNLSKGSCIADIGSGTGKLSELFLPDEFCVYAVEPNKEMREAAETLFKIDNNFRSVAGESSKTTLADNSVDLVTVAQAFHWFDPFEAKKEFKRILKPGGHIALIWNNRNTSSPFQEDYDQILTRHAPDYAKSSHRNISDKEIADFFFPQICREFSFTYSQKFDLQGFLGRMNSASYTPKPDTKEHLELRKSAKRLYNKYEKNNMIEFSYVTKLYLV
ncbi:hypothetical protein AB833_04465 [Chromatiales bacterium (ex Bugula neritina AB1)]|nr:hypothetical protein AB833_04465 [Chromatiales bacterium (ex Bugula neritina AB1)]